MNVPQEQIFAGELRYRKSKRSVVPRLLLFGTFLVTAIGLSAVSYQLLVKHDRVLVARISRIAGLKRVSSVRPAELWRSTYRVISKHGFLPIISVVCATAGLVFLYASRHRIQ